jgi:GntR family transcriptional regulator
MSEVPALATFQPLYQQIKTLLMQSLESGEWKPGEMIPAETELALRFKVSQGTVRKAIDELSAENLLIGISFFTSD